MRKVALAVLTLMIFWIQSVAQENSYKEQLPIIAASARKDIEAKFLALKNKLGVEEYMQYASYRPLLVVQLNESSSLYQTGNYDGLLKQVKYWYELSRTELGQPNEMPSTRKTKMAEIMESRWMSKPVTQAYEVFLNSYSVYHKKVWMRKAYDSTQIVVDDYLSKLRSLQTEIDRSPEKEQFGGLEMQLTGIRNYQQLTEFSSEVKSLLDAISSSKDYLEDDGFFAMTLQQKVSAGWKPKNVVEFGESIYESLKSKNLKAYSKHFLPYERAKQIYQEKYKDFSLDRFNSMQKQAEASFNRVLRTLEENSIVLAEISSISDYKSLDYMNTVSPALRKTYSMKYDIYIAFATNKGKYLLTLKEVDNSSLKDKVKHLSEIELSEYQ